MDLAETQLQKRFREQRDLQDLDFPEAEFLRATSAGRNCLHLAAAFGSIDAIPASLMVATHICRPDKNLDTPLHIAAKSGRLSGFPLGEIPSAAFYQPNHQGQSVIDIANAHGHADQLPTHISHSSSTEVVSQLLEAIKTISVPQLPAELLDFNLWALPVSGDRFGASYFHRAAKEGILHDLPSPPLSPQAFSLRDWQDETPVAAAIKSRSLAKLVDQIPADFQWDAPTGNRGGTTLLHLAAEHQQIRFLPARLLTREAISRRNEFGRTVADVAYTCGSIDDLPQELRWLSEAYHRQTLPAVARSNELHQLPADFDWLQEDTEGNTPLHVFAEAGRVYLIPEALLTRQNLIRKDASGQTVADLAFRRGGLDRLPEVLRWTSQKYAWSRFQDALREHALHTLPDHFDWLSPKQGGDTPLHHAARAGQLSGVPSDVLTVESASIQNQAGQSVAELAFANDCILDLPTEARHVSDCYNAKLILDAFKCGRLQDVPAQLWSPERLASPVPGDASEKTFLHHAALLGCLSEIPLACLTSQCLTVTDIKGDTPLHDAARSRTLGSLPSDLLRSGLLKRCNSSGQSVYHIAAAQPGFGGLSHERFSKEILLSTDSDGTSVADVAFEHGTISILPDDLRWLSRREALGVLKECLVSDFPKSKAIHHERFQHAVPAQEFQVLRRNFVQEWARKVLTLDPDDPYLLDEEQAETVAEGGCHIQVTARAGSGKTRSLVARALFLIKHCRVNPKKILILAFNRKAVGEVRDRIEPHLEEQERPHVLTFHSLAWRIVRPSEEILYDEGEADEGKRLSQTIQEIIRTELREGSLEAEIRDLMRVNWESSLARIIANGFDLPQHEFEELRERMHDVTLDGRRVTCEEHKWIGNFLLRHDLDYTYRRSIGPAKNGRYTPDFLHYKKGQASIIIESAGPQGSDAAREIFWKTDRAAQHKLIQIPADAFADQKTVSSILAQKLNEAGVHLKALSKKALWEKIRDKKIDDFTAAIQQFIGRCQKELIWPADLSQLIEQQRECSDLQTKFWTLAHDIYERYEAALGNDKTDFDRLMLAAVDRIRKGRTKFSSKDGSGDLQRLEHLLIDEYQDFSHLFNELREAIVEKNSAALFFCVGDDWQAINQFAGSNLKYFREFRSDFAPCCPLEITKNYRSCRSVVETGNEVMRGEGTPAKVGRPDRSGQVFLAKSCLGSELTPQEEAVSERFDALGVDILRLAQQILPEPNDPKAKEKTVAVLTRRSSIAASGGNFSLEQWQKGLRKFLPEHQREHLSVSTVHGFKGREAHTVILIEPETYPLIHPNSIFNTIFGDTHDSIVSDEKRLFYVGVTRAERNLYLLHADPSEPIQFLSTGGLPPCEISTLTSDLLLGNEVMVTLQNSPSARFETEGTVPIKEQLMAPEIGFTWQPERKYWFKRLPLERLADSNACHEFLTASPWIGNAHRIIASFESDAYRVQYLIEKGTPNQLGRTLSAGQLRDLENLQEALREPLSALLKSLHLDHDVPWPEFGYEGVDASGACDGSLLEVAWPDHRVGIGLPSDTVDPLLARAWTIYSADGVSITELLSHFSA